MGEEKVDHDREATVGDDRLAEAKDALRRREKLEGLLSRAEQSLTQQRARVQELEGQLGKEARDVEQLEGRGLVTLFHTVLGSKEEQLERERQEYLAARLRYEEAQAAVAGLEQEVAALGQELAALGDVERAYQRLFEERQAAMLAAGDERAGQLLAVSMAAADARADLREVDEAIGAGRLALASLQKAESSLSSAERWGVWDVLGGGLVATAVKHSRVDEGRDAVQRAQQQLRRFSRELADVEAADAGGIEIGSFATFADYFFDGLIADWVVQSRIATSLEQVRDTQDRVGRVLQELDRARARLASTRERLEEEQREIVEGG